ncbi:hypothetical protein JHK85_043833 [Glycine max]|nr:hypothetical protein JHK85_043833 [Glycine max]
MTEPRLFGTHIPFHALAKSIKESNSRIIYICRNPLDTFVSSWIFLNKIKPEHLPEFELGEAFENYCKGIIGFGPTWNQMLGYWKESIARPSKVLFLKYEDLKKDANFHVKRIAEFLGCLFTFEEERDGMIESIIKLCSFEKMKELEANKSGTFARNFKRKHLLRKAEMGDWDARMDKRNRSMKKEFGELSRGSMFVKNVDAFGSMKTEEKLFELLVLPREPTDEPSSA